MTTEFRAAIAEIPTEELFERALEETIKDSESDDRWEFVGDGQHSTSECYATLIALK